jgi:LemA protein
MLIFTGAVVVLAVIFFAWYAGTYNSLISARNATDQSWSNVEVDLTRRLDLIGNLVETVKGYAKHERETLEKVIAARGAAASASGPAAVSQAEGQITQALRGLLAVAEAYPELKADANFRALQEQLTQTEDRIAAVRSGYNSVARQYRDRCQSFPSMIVAGLHNFEPKPFFDVPDELVARAPQVSFS